MGIYNKYTPYVEAPTVRTTVQPVSGGIVIDIGTAQGASFRNRNLRQTTLLPQLDSGQDNFAVECLNFGFSTPVDESLPFSDRGKVTALSYLEDPNQFGDSFIVGDFLPIEGAIEPLIIRDVATRESIEDPISHRIRGTIMGGNEDYFDGADINASHFLYDKNSDFVPFEDSVETTAGGSILIIGFVAEAFNDKTEPYDDSEIDTRNLTNNSDINAQLLAMTGSIDDDFRPINSKASTSGFVYSNKEGTDSLAFGGLLR